ncbi:nucleolar protein,Nop52-domain-containing protein [Endogone sp. FLAS-F59071]|nr:nucleolar protein,Nop52-domain-containing protein [Endogone sp. FLAS-F59071]|eukprot:RUS17985.1 nucleolar protein,Nop52-domain-containing protein [Endogone sp. FLAS-F59071]
MTSFKEQETIAPFGKQLAANDRKTRDKAVKSLQLYLSSKKQFSNSELLKLWKGLFYCKPPARALNQLLRLTGFWMSDKPLVQQALADTLASLVLQMPQENAIAFIDAFWQTMSAEWYGIDRLRLDKYYLLLRKFVNYSFKLLAENSWSDNMVTAYLDVLKTGPLNPTSAKIPDSIRYHVVDVWLEELEKVVGAQLSTLADDEDLEVPTARLIDPMIQLMAQSKNSVIIKRVIEGVLQPVLEKFIKELDRLESLVESEDASGEDEDVTNPYIYDIGSIRHALFAAGADPTTSDANRRKLYALYQSYNEILGNDEDEDGEDEKNDGEKQSEDGEEDPEKDGWEDVGETSDTEEEELVGKKKGKENGHVNGNGKQHEKQNGMGNKGAGKGGKGAGAAQVARTKPPKTKDAKVVHDPARRTNDNMVEMGMDWEGEDGEVEEKPTAKEGKGKKRKASSNGARKNGGEISLAEAHAAAGEGGGQQENGKRKGKKGKGTVSGSAMTSFVISASPIVANAKMSANPFTPTASPASAAKIAAITTPASATLTALSGSLPSSKKKVQWKLENNTVKRFNKKLPMQTIPEPIVCSTLPIKSALRDWSGSRPSSPPSPSPIGKANKANKANGSIT